MSDSFALDRFAFMEHTASRWSQCGVSWRTVQRPLAGSDAVGGDGGGVVVPESVLGATMGAVSTAVKQVVTIGRC